MQKFKLWLEVIKSNYEDLVMNKSKPNEYSIIDSKTGGRAYLKIGKHFNTEKADYDGDKIGIINWYAAPSSEVMARGLAAYDDYKGGGFARNVMKKILELAKSNNIKILEIFAPSDDSQRTLEHYTHTGLLTPIPYSKAALADFHTAFIINRYDL